MSKIEFPNLLLLAIQNTKNIDGFEEINQHLSEMLDWLDSEEENHKIIPIKIILNLLQDKIRAMKNNCREFYDKFPDMSVPEWEKLNERFQVFISKQDDLNLN